jgi:hypothetical protein
MRPLYTPGPWGLRGYQIRADGGQGTHVATYQCTESDGSLIAAAPDLYEALVTLLQDLPSATTEARAAVVAKARAAIAKAARAPRFAAREGE